MKIVRRQLGSVRLKPIIDRVFPFEGPVEAFRYYEAAQLFGKIVISHK